MSNKYIKSFEAKDKFPNIKKVKIEEFDVYIGRDSKSNDYLTFEMCGDEDIWMHAKGVPGSHVVIFVKENLPTEDIIKKVGMLARENSKAKGVANAPIVYCKRKFVKKNPGMNDGQVAVDYKNSYEVKI